MFAEVREQIRLNKIYNGLKVSDDRPRFVNHGDLSLADFRKKFYRRKTRATFIPGLKTEFLPIMGASPATWYMREDGTAASVGAATGPGSVQADCMSMAIHNADALNEIVPGDLIYICDEGGIYVIDEMEPPSSGTALNPILYRIEVGDSVVIDAANSGTPTLDLRGVDYVEVYGDNRLELISGAAGDPVIRFDNTESCLVENAHIHGGVTSAVTFQNVFGLDTKNNILRGCNISGSTTEGVYLKNNHAVATTVADNIIEDCWIHTGGTMETIQNSHDTIPANAPTGTIFRDCIIEDGGDTSTAQLMQDVLVERCLFQNLGSPDYGIIMLDGGGAATIRNNLIMGATFNQVRNCGGIFIGASANVVIRHNTILDITNVGAGTGTCIRKTNLGAGGTIQFNILSGSDDQMIFDAAPALASYNCIDGPASDTGANAVVADPRFINPGTNYRLLVNSPCIDAAVGSTATEDLDENPRPKGVRNDIGCYEYQGTIGAGEGLGKIRWPFRKRIDSGLRV